MRRSCVWLLLSLLAGPIVPGETESPSLSWILPDGSVVWTAPLTHEPVATDPAPRPLTAGPWFPPLPDVEFRPLEGAPYALSDHLGRVLILDFWAIWCEPCAEELTLLQALQEKEGERGLEVVTVNMQEPADTARQFAWALNLHLPIVRYTPDLERAFEVRSLPTLILADRKGRIRGRWTGYRPGIDEQIADQARGLLTPTEESAMVLADVLVGGELLEVRWSRRVPGKPEGLALVAGETTTLLVAAGRELLHYDGRGRILQRKMGRTTLGRLVSGDLDGNGHSGLVAMRRGGTRIVPVDAETGAGESWEAPAPVLDLEILPPGWGGEKSSLLLATLTGLHRSGFDGSPPRDPFRARGCDRRRGCPRSGSGQAGRPRFCGKSAIPRCRIQPFGPGRDTRHRGLPRERAG